MTDIYSNLQLRLIFAICIVGFVQSWIIPVATGSRIHDHRKVFQFNWAHSRYGSRLYVYEPMDEKSKKSRSKSATKTNQDEMDNTSKPVASRKKKTPKEPSFWLVDDDNVRVERNDDERISLFHFKIRGNPKPLERHRFGRGHTYNPSRVHQVNFRNLMKTIAASQNIFEYPLFREDDCLAVDIVLRMKRPTSHFADAKRGPDTIKPTAPRRIGKFRGDVDNNVKFLLDAMNELVFPDDRQVSRLSVTRILDSDDLCEGSTEIRLRIIRDDDLDLWTNSAIQDGES